MLTNVEQKLPDWLWNPADHWSRLKGYGRMFIFAALLCFLLAFQLAGTLFAIVGMVLYGYGLLGLRMTVEKRRKDA
jgi:hypothetical protein